MTQFKDKADRREFVSAGLFTYPVLMAGDILLYQTDIASRSATTSASTSSSRATSPSASTRASARRSSCPRAIYPEVGARIMDLQEPTRKMSTTGGTEQGTVKLLDEPDVIRKKFRSAVTDSGREIRRGDDKPGVSNLIDILSVATGSARPGEIEVAYEGVGLRRAQARRRRGGRRAARPGARALPRAPRRRAASSCACSPSGADKARAASAPTIEAMYERMGFVRLAP